MEGTGKLFSVEIPSWKIRPEGPDTLILRESRRVLEEEKLLLEYEFTVRSVPCSARVTLEAERTFAERRNGTNPFTTSRLAAELNGKPLRERIRTGTVFDREIAEADLAGLLVPGRNVLRIVQRAELLEENLLGPEPPMIFGAFGTEGGAITEAPSESVLPCWEGTALANVSGAVRFSARVRLPEECRGKRIRLTLKEVREIAEVFANGRLIGTRVMEPYRFEIPAEVSREGEFELTLRIVNTPANRYQEPRTSGVAGGLVWEVIFSPYS